MGARRGDRQDTCGDGHFTGSRPQSIENHREMRFAVGFRLPLNVRDVTDQLRAFLNDHLPVLLDGLRGFQDYAIADFRMARIERVLKLRRQLSV